MAAWPALALVAPASLEAPPSAHLPEPGKKNARIGQVEANIGGAAIAVFEENSLPGLAAIGRPIDATLFVGTEQMSEGRGESYIRVSRMNDHGADLAFLLPNMLPGLGGIGGFVDAVARGYIAARICLAGPRIDDIRIGRCDSHRAHR